MDSTLGSYSKSQREADILAAEKYVASVAKKFSRMNGMDEDDMRQECWLEVVKAARRSDSEHLLAFSAKTGAIHAVRSHRRGKRQIERDAIRIGHDDFDIECDEAARDPLFSLFIKRAMQDLTRMEFTCLYGLYWLEMTDPEIAKSIGRDVKTVFRARKRAIEKLKLAMLGGLS